MALEKKKSKLSGRSERSKPVAARPRVCFAVCIQGTEFDLMTGKAYRVLKDVAGTRLGYVRVIDESGEDYLYPTSWFVPIRLERNSQRRLAAALRTAASPS